MTTMTMSSTTTKKTKTKSTRDPSIRYATHPDFEGYVIGEDGSVWSEWAFKGSGYEIVHQSPSCSMIWKTGRLRITLFAGVLH